MEVLKAIEFRKSIRGYKSACVPKDYLKKILEVSRRAPSGMNNQPWELIVLAGDVLEMVKRVNEEQLRAGILPHPDVPDPQFTGAQRERQVKLAKQLYQVLEIRREDTAKRLDWAAKGIRFFDAPIGIIVSMEDEAFQNPVCLIDVGLILQTIALAALEFGLGTCIQRQVVRYPQALKKALDIPESKHLVIGMSIGYPDWDFPPNQVRSERKPLGSLVTCQEVKNECNNAEK